MFVAAVKIRWTKICAGNKLFEMKKLRTLRYFMS